MPVVIVKYDERNRYVVDDYVKEPDECTDGEHSKNYNKENIERERVGRKEYPNTYRERVNTVTRKLA